MSGVSDAWAGAAPDRPGTCRALSPEGGQERGGPGVGEAAGLMWISPASSGRWRAGSRARGCCRPVSGARAPAVAARLRPVPTRSRRGGSELGRLSSHAGQRGPVGFGHSGGPAGGRNSRGGEGVPEAAVTAAARLGGADVSPCRKPGRGRTCGCGSEAPFGGSEQGACEDERCGVEISEVLPCLIVMEGFVFGRVSGRS